jgi:hypothetical protein
MLFLIKYVLAMNELPFIPKLEMNCEQKLKFNNADAELINLVAVFRHGDRAPLKIKNELWRNKVCISCNGDCSRVPCDDGMVTMKGFIQSKNLGEFIKKFYVPKFRSIKSTFAFRSQLPRSYTTIRAVFEGLDISVGVQMEKSLMNDYLTTSIKNYILKEKKLKIKTDSSFEYAQFDHLITSYCNGMPFMCNGPDCNSANVERKYSHQLKSFLNVLDLTRNNFITNGISLGDLGNFIKTETLRENSISLVSSHDSTIIKLLQGLNIPVEFVPPYSSTVFIEVWKTFDQKKFVRVVYEGEVKEIGLYNEKMIEMKNFIRYLDMFNIPNSKLKSLSKLNKLKSLGNSNTNIRELAKITEDIYQPILNEMKNDTDLKKYSFLRSLLLSNPFLMIRDGISYLRSFLFNQSENYENTSQHLFGWFESKKEEIIEIKQNVEDEDGSTHILIIQCPKNGNGNCKTVSKQKVENGNIKIKKDENDSNKKTDKNEKDPKIVDSGSCEKAKINTPCDNPKINTPCEKLNTPCEKLNTPCEKLNTPCEKANTPCEKANTTCDGSKTNMPCETPRVLHSDIDPIGSNKSCDIKNLLPCDNAPKQPCSDPVVMKQIEKPITSAFETLPGTETVFKTQGCNLINKTIPQTFFGPRPMPFVKIDSSGPCSNNSVLFPEVRPSFSIPNISNIPNLKPCQRPLNTDGRCPDESNTMQSIFR